MKKKLYSLFLLLILFSAGGCLSKEKEEENAKEEAPIAREVDETYYRAYEAGREAGRKEARERVEAEFSKARTGPVPGDVESYMEGANAVIGYVRAALSGNEPAGEKCPEPGCENGYIANVHPGLPVEKELCPTCDGSGTIPAEEQTSGEGADTRKDSGKGGDALSSASPAPRTTPSPVDLPNPAGEKGTPE